MRIDPETNNLLREGVPSVVNPYDAYALEMALRIKDEQPGVKITALTMGPGQAESALRQCLSLGADDACLVSGSAFSGSDTLATSYALSKAIAQMGPFDLILCGRQAIDGDTAQTGPELAEHLDCPQITLVKELRLDSNGIRAVRETQRGTEVWTSSLPALVTVTKPEFEPRCPTVGAKLAAKRAAIRVLNIDDIRADPERCGAKGSPTVVQKTFTPAAKKDCVFVHDAAELVALLNNKELYRSIKSPPLREGGGRRPVGGCDVWAWLENPGETELLHHGRRIASLLETGLTAVMLGHNIASAAHAVRGADRVIFIDGPVFSEYNTELYAAAMHQLIKNYGPDTILFGATCNGRDLAPRLACRLRTGLTADCTGLNADTRTGHVQWIRPAFSGNLMAVIECPRARPQMGTVRLTGNTGPLPTANDAPEIIQERPVDLPLPRAQMIERHDEPETGDALLNAEVIVAGGRGLGQAENVSLLHELAQALGGTVAGSRAAADAGWLSRTRQVGQTGSMVSPRLYIACGISGAVQHLVGIHGANMIVAVNSDPEASIFGAADFGIAGDLREVLPAMAAEIRRMKNEGGGINV